MRGVPILRVRRIEIMLFTDDRLVGLELTNRTMSGKYLAFRFAKPRGFTSNRLLS